MACVKTWQARPQSGRRASGLQRLSSTNRAVRPKPSRWAAVVSIAEKFGRAPHTPYEWTKKAEVESGKRAEVPTEVADKLKALQRENREPRQFNQILCKGTCVFCPGEARPPLPAMIALIDDHREAYSLKTQL
ncbi:transposase-like protein [Sphingomonas sp. 1185]